jgi:hypothetical protein
VAQIERQCRRRLSSFLAGAVTGLALASGSAHADTEATGAVAKDFSEWFVRSDQAKETQPHWMTPVITVTPRLEQEYRYDQLWQDRPNDVSRTNYGLNKGLELIPTPRTEVIISVPGYIKDTSPAKDQSGWADETLLLKYRFLSANEEHGNYIFTGFVGVTLPTGSGAYTADQTIWTPTISGGKGWGTRTSGFDIQSTLGVSYAVGGQAALGQPLVWNTAFQGHVLSRLWPELEVNYMRWMQGDKAGESQTAIAGGCVLGRYELGHRVKFAAGVAYQKAVTSVRTFDDSWILTLRFAF